MDSDTTNAASWNPALMPNTLESAPSSGSVDASAAAPPAQPESEREPQPQSEPESEPEAEAESTSEPAAQHLTQHHHEEGGAFLDQFHQDDEADAGGWDLSNPLDSEEPQPDPEGAPDAPGSSFSPDVDVPATSTASKHASTISFARTVSHEVNFLDDDDAEWDLQRSDTDPFKFMPPNERTNSFPPVPPTDAPLEHPPPSSQAQDIMQHLDDDESASHDAAPQDHAQSPANASPHDVPTNSAAFEQTVGGDLVGAEEDESEARFEEGVPLIPQETETNDLPAPDQIDAATPLAKDPFAEDEPGDTGDGDGDDFFSQINTSHNDASEDDFAHALHRKSTTVAMGGALVNARDADDADSDNETSGQEPDTAPAPQTESDNLDAKWAAAFGDDDDDGDFLAEPDTEKKELDPSDVFGSDDEGFLEDDEPEQPAAPLAAPQTPAAMQPTLQQQQSPGLNARYAPGSVQPPYSQPTPNPYAPQPSITPMLPGQNPLYGAPAASAPPATFAPPPQPRPEVPKAQSFADKSKGGYQSPYDLPMDIVKPKKRPSTQQLPRTSTSPGSIPTAPPPGPPRASSAYQPGPPAATSNPTLTPPGSSHSTFQQAAHAAPPPSQKPAGQLKPQSASGFFEDLPISSSRSRPASRTNNHASPSQQSPYAQPQAPPTGLPQGAQLPTPPVQTSIAPPPIQQPPAQAQAPVTPQLVAPERMSPYGSAPSGSQPKANAPPAVTSRYSPAPPGQPSALGPQGPAVNRYSPAPPSRSNSGSYSAVGVSPQGLAHQPRTSSPLAHFETSHDRNAGRMASPANADGAPVARSASSYEPRLTRVPSLPPTQELDENVSPVRSPPIAPKTNPLSPPPESRYSPVQHRHTPPPGAQVTGTLSPPKRTTPNYAPPSQPTQQVSFAPSPEGAQSATPQINPVAAGAQNAQPPKPFVRARGMSQPLTLVEPTDGREHDPLQRWKGAPLTAWGVGGTFVTFFTKDIPRYGINQTMPMIVRSPGEVKVQHIKDVLPLEDRLSKFPGPLKGKGKKKETITWLNAGIETLERDAPNVSFQQTVSHDDKRAIERLLLWKILRVMVENDGVLEGNPTVDKAVRDIISPGLDGQSSEMASAISAGVDLTGLSSPTTATQADAVDSSSVEQIRRFLLAGDREKAAWAAVDKRLWGHAMLIANTTQNPGLYKQVAQEFIKKEINLPGQNNESLAALYGVLSGNLEESVDELVPVHARAGLQLMSTSAAVGESKDALAGLDKWRETLGMILSNRSAGDIQALSSLGNLLASYGRAEAAHICYIFARGHSVFGGLDDPTAHFVLVGADHKSQAHQFAQETEALFLSEVYEYGLSLTGAAHASSGCPHLAAYKLQTAMTLAEYGFRDKALQYCDAIMNAMVSQTKRSPYYHPVLESAVDDLMKRLKHAPKEGSNSWISKPSMNNVSNNMWSRFNKFVAGDDNDNNGDGSGADGAGESGPFARIAGGTPNISRAPSMTGLDAYGNSMGMSAMTGFSPSGPPTKAGSMYAPSVSQTLGSPFEPSSGFNSNPTARSSMERASGEYQRSSNEMSRGVGDSGNPYAPQNSSRPSSSYQPSFPAASQAGSPYTPLHQSSPQASAPQTSSYSPYAPYGQAPSEPSAQQPVPASECGPDHQANDGPGYQAPSYGFEPPSMGTFDPPSMQAEDNTASGGYEPPSFQPSTFEPSSFEPPSYEPGPAGDDDEPKPKKKFMLDDDEDDIPGLRPQAEDKSKAEKDRENEEMFRKVAEEEAKREAEAKNSKKSGWGFGSWFGGAKKESLDQPANKPIKAKLGEQSSFVYDPDLKRWINKKPGAENTPAKTATPPPPRASGMSTPPPPGGLSAAPSPGGPPMGPPRSASAMSIPAMNKTMSQENLLAPPGPANGAPPMMARSVSNQSAISDAGGAPVSQPPSRPTTSLSTASSIDDLIGAAGPRKGKKPRKSGRYVDVMAK